MTTEAKIDWFEWLKSLPTKCSSCGGDVPWKGIPEGVTEEEYAKFREVGNPNIIIRGQCRSCGEESTVQLLKDLEDNYKLPQEKQLPMNVVAHSSFKKSDAKIKNSKGD